MPDGSTKFRFDVAFSFSGTHRETVRAIAGLVAAEIGKASVFLDEWYEDELGGDDADCLLQHFYEQESLMVVADVSEDYASRRFPQAEARAIRALRSTIDTARDQVSRLRLAYIRFDAGKVHGVTDLAITWSVQEKTVEELAALVISRLRKLQAGLRLSNGAAIMAGDPGSDTEPPEGFLKFVHPATNDALYSRRERDLAWLDECAKDKGIRIATVTGVGGLGKTSLVGQWIEKARGWRNRAFRGVFFYSFYADREPEHFFTTFLAFICEREKIAAPGKDTPLHHAAATAAQRWCYLVVLDGLEVLQRDENDPHYGWINDGPLNEFVARVGAAGPSLLILTSRFPFPELTAAHPDAARAKALDLFDEEEGADLLARCGLPGERTKLKEYSALFGGHPLALRLFAGACAAEPWDEPDAVSQHVQSDRGTGTLPDPDVPGLDDAERTRRKQRRQFYELLHWLQRKLPAPKRRLLQLVAFFREPVASGTLMALATGLDAMKADFTDCDAARIHELLDALVRENLLQRAEPPGSDTARWATHPIVREVFREEALKSGGMVAQQFAGIVAGNPRGTMPETAAELQPILEAIAVLLDAQDFRGADALYAGRLKDGKAFQWIPAPQEGLRCARTFVESRENRPAIERALGSVRVAFYLNEMALRAMILGEMESVERGYAEGNEFDYARKAWSDVCIGLHNIVEAQTLRGALIDAVQTAGEALFYAGVKEPPAPGLPASVLARRPASVPAGHPRDEIVCRTVRGHALSLGGEVSAASRDFVAADRLHRQVRTDHGALYSVSGLQWCRHRLRLADASALRRLTEANRVICQRNGWNEDIARCDLLLGELDANAGDFDSAAARIGEAVTVFRETRQGQDLLEALLAQARLRGSLDDCEEALRLSARSGFALKHCDALNLRAQLRREADQSTDALNDARDALEIADRCSYHWGRHEALRQLRDTAQALGQRADERHWDDAERSLSAKMQPLIAEALEIEQVHDHETEALYGKK